MSTRKAASAIGVSQTLILTIFHDDLHLKPYKFHNFQALEDADYEKRLIFANWFISLPKLTEMFMFFSDEAYFYLRLPINKQNNRYWGDTDQQYTVEVPLHDEKVFSEKMWFINNLRRWPYWIKINIFQFHIKFYSFLLKMIYRFWNGDDCWLFYKLFKKTKIHFSPCIFHIKKVFIALKINSFLNAFWLLQMDSYIWVTWRERN